MLRVMLAGYSAFAHLTADRAVLYRAILDTFVRAKRGRFDELTAKAQAFMSSLQRTIDLHGLSVDALVAYKQSLIDYLERFIGELVLATAEITERLQALDDQGVARLLAAARRELADALDPTPAERDQAEAMECSG